MVEGLTGLRGCGWVSLGVAEPIGSVPDSVGLYYFHRAHLVLKGLISFEGAVGIWRLGFGDLGSDQFKRVRLGSRGSG